MSPRPGSRPVKQPDRAASGFTRTEKKYMKMVLQLALRGLGSTEPNPLVGAVVTKSGRLVASGFHRSYGGHHAEREALMRVNESGCTLFVNLEPCAHTGKTAPCTDIILEKRVKRVVLSSRDPNPLVNGRGIHRLKQHGIEVREGLYDELNQQLNRHYFTFMRSRKPYVAVKAGISLDGQLTDKTGRSKWITDKELRAVAHALRTEFSAVLVGARTVAADNARLTLRTPDWRSKELTRVVLDTHNTLSADLHIFKHRPRSPLIVFSSDKARNRNVKCPRHFFVPAREDMLDLKRVLEILAGEGIASVLVEGGGAVIDSFLQQELYNEVLLFYAHRILGGRDALQLFGSGRPLREAIRFKRTEMMELQNGHIFRGFR